MAGGLVDTLLPLVQMATQIDITIHVLDWTLTHERVVHEAGFGSEHATHTFLENQK
jgi:hypothetical protein